jgi:hypothetical protein
LCAKRGEQQSLKAVSPYLVPFQSLSAATPLTVESAQDMETGALLAKAHGAPFAVHGKGSLVIQAELHAVAIIQYSRTKNCIAIRNTTRPHASLGTTLQKGSRQMSGKQRSNLEKKKNRERTDAPEVRRGKK